MVPTSLPGTQPSHETATFVGITAFFASGGESLDRSYFAIAPFGTSGLNALRAACRKEIVFVGGMQAGTAQSRPSHANATVPPVRRFLVSAQTDCEDGEIAEVSRAASLRLSNNLAVASPFNLRVVAS